MEIKNFSFRVPVKKKWQMSLRGYQPAVPTVQLGIPYRKINLVTPGSAKMRLNATATLLRQVVPSYAKVAPSYA